MALFNHATKEVTAKLVYYGPGLCGKTTNLQWIHDKVSFKTKGKLVSLATQTDRTLFFDFLPVELGTIRGMRTRMQIYTVPGQVFYESTRRMVLKGCDAVVFVADSQAAMLDANAESLRSLRQNLLINEIDPSIPQVIQYNKRDLPTALPISVLNERLNPRSLPYFEAVAFKGTGVEETLKGITKLLFQWLSHYYGDTEAAASAATAGIGAAPAEGGEGGSHVKVVVRDPRPALPTRPEEPPKAAPARPAAPPAPVRPPAATATRAAAIPPATPRPTLATTPPVAPPVTPPPARSTEARPTTPAAPFEEPLPPTIVIAKQRPTTPTPPPAQPTPAPRPTKPAAPPDEETLPPTIVIAKQRPTTPTPQPPLTPPPAPLATPPLAPVATPPVAAPPPHARPASPAPPPPEDELASTIVLVKPKPAAPLTTPPPAVILPPPAPKRPPLDAPAQTVVIKTQPIVIPGTPTVKTAPPAVNVSPMPAAPPPVFRPEKPAAPADPPPRSEGVHGDQWLYLLDGTQRGPIDVEDLIDLVLTSIPENTKVWHPGLEGWVHANQIREIADEIPPPIPIPGAPPRGVYVDEDMPDFNTVPVMLRTVLIADEDAAFRKYLAMPLAAQGFTIYEAADGAAAWQLAVQNRPWMILADISMPEVDGFEFCRRVRNHALLSRMPLLFISGSDKYKERYRALQIGADDFLSKNMPVRELLMRIQLLMTRYSDLSSGEQKSGTTEVAGAFQGRIEVFGAPALLQMCSQGRLTGLFTALAEDAANTATVMGFREGDIISAMAGDATGADGVYAFLAWEKGSFKFTPGDPGEGSPLAQSVEHLLLEGCRLIDEARKGEGGNGATFA